MDPKPTLDVENLRCPPSLEAKRRKAQELILARAHSDADRKHIAAILRKLRARQTRLLKEKDEDPSPYDPRYIFYCLTGTRESYT